MKHWLALGVWVLGIAPALAAGGELQVCKRIPADVAAVLLLDRPADAIRQGGAVLERFKTLHPDLDLARLGAKVQAELGDNLLTAEGMTAFGLDPQGTVALYFVDFEADPVLVFGLRDADRFVSKLQAIHRRDLPAGTALPAPVVRAGAKIHDLNGDRVAIRDGWAMILPPAGRSAADPVQAFFGPGRKLADHKPFSLALSGLPKAQHVIGYLSVEALAGAFDRDMAEQIASASAELRQKSSGSKDWIRQRQAGLQLVRKRTGAWIRQFQSLVGGLEVTPGAVEATVLATTQPEGARALRQILPVGTGEPVFHARLAAQSMMAGWAGVRLGALIAWMGDLPTSPWQLFGAEMDQARDEFRQQIGMDLRADVFGNQREPLAAYFLTPDLSDLKTDDPSEAQFLQLVRFLVVSRVADPAKLEQLLARLDEMLRLKQLTFESQPLTGGSLRVMRPRPGVEVAWGHKGEAAFFGFGPNATGPLTGLDGPAGWAADGGSPDRGLGRLDFAALGEVLSSAVSKGIGGRAGVQFRMTWPLVQQAFARFDQFVVRAQVTTVGLVLRASLGLH